MTGFITSLLKMGFYCAGEHACLTNPILLDIYNVFLCVCAYVFIINDVMNISLLKALCTSLVISLGSISRGWIVK